jgi:hypothetical protein
MNSYIILNNSLVVVTGGKQYAVDSTHPSYTAIVEAIKAGDFAAIPNLADVGKRINDTGRNEITVVDGRVMYGNDEMHNALTDRLLAMLHDGFSIDPMLALLKNLMANPTKTAIDEFYLFIETNKLPITEDGCILAYKRVDDNYFDSYTHEVVNKPASLMTDEELAEGPWKAGSVTTEVINGQTVVSMPAGLVDADRAIECSVGLHFCSLSYLGNFYAGSGHILIVKVNPADIVAIPHDYNNTKGRCWKYTVIESLELDETRNLTEEVYNEVSVVPADVFTLDHKQYDAGYKAGRARIELTEVHFMQAPAFKEGYKDGRGKQKRKYPAIKTTQE